jgi:hypothetical protein
VRVLNIFSVQWWVKAILYQLCDLLVWMVFWLTLSALLILVFALWGSFHTFTTLVLLRALQPIL